MLLTVCSRVRHARVPLCPRLRDFPDYRFAAIAALANYPSIAFLLGKRIRVDVICEHWDEVLRLIASLKAGHVAPSTMLRKLAAYERQNQIDIALQELGKLSGRCSCSTGLKVQRCAATAKPG